MDLPSPSDVDARHVVLVIAHGLHGELPPLDDLPNLKSMRRLGMSIDRCATGARSPLETLLLAGEDGGLAGAALRGGRRLLQVLPWRPAGWVAERTRGAHCAVVENRLDDGTRSWEDLMEAAPQVVTGGHSGGDGAGAHHDTLELAGILRERVIPRFPGRSTMVQTGTDPLQAWLTWVSDAFLRGLWYASSRWTGGLVGVLCHPAPGLLARHDPEGGYEDGLAVIDDLIGRLLVLSEHRELDGAAVILCGDGGNSSPAEHSRDPHVTTPVLMAGAGIDTGRRDGGMELADVGRWLREMAAAPASPGMPRS